MEPVLQFPDFSREFVLTKDASNIALGAVLSQGVIGQDLPVAYAISNLNKPERNYSTIDQELLSIIWNCSIFRLYIHGRKFKIVKDHKPLAYRYPKKVTLGLNRVKFIVYLLCKGHFHIDPDQVAPILNFQRSRTLKDVQQFLCIIGYYSHFNDHYSEIAAPLYILNMKGIEFVWGPNKENALLANVDASSLVLGAVLSQRVECGLAPVAFASRTLSEAEQNLGIYEKEMLACIVGLENFVSYIEHEECDLYTDHQALSWV
ncbi:hypothetical protein PR048_029947 [Dryococelus australis]|uniref:Reverse transcriptase RNase H-like domain-containing protein n=1 Tax=Dryococelus australis TaxID=614101 RepID=A0ABQ9G7K2_9NEOP|nr:hypothetical protein PR048_029947 [Dryococelus australis]